MKINKIYSYIDGSLIMHFIPETILPTGTAVTSPLAVKMILYRFTRVDLQVRLHSILYSITKMCHA